MVSSMLVLNVRGPSAASTAWVRPNLTRRFDTGEDSITQPPEQSPLDPQREMRRLYLHDYYLKRRAEHPEKYVAALKNRNPERKRETDRAFYERHIERERERSRERQRKRRQTAEGKACDKAYREAHTEETRLAQRARQRANKERVNLYKRTRRAREQGATGSHSVQDVLAQLARQKGKCYWCNGKLPSNYHVDHVTPLAQGGSDGPENIVIACPTCNHRKSAKHPMDWNGTLL